MKPVIPSELSNLPPSALNALENCSEESIYAPGYIQPHGVLLVLQEPHLKIVQVSETVEQFFNIPAAAILGQPLNQLFPRTQVKRIASYLTQNNLEFCNPFELKTRRAPQPFRGTLHRTTDTLLLELEPLLPSKNTYPFQFYHRLQTAILNLRSATNLSELAQVLAKTVKVLAGFDRVMVYRFEADEHGVVIAEEKEPHLESYLGLHYPAIDIPAPARKLFYRNWVRHIPDVKAPSARLLPMIDAASPIDLSPCVLRGVSPYHIEYLQNMGVCGSLTIALVDDQRLWGLIACHHYSPRLVDYETRKTCEFLGQFASIELVHQQERELSQYRAQIKAIQVSLHQAFLREPNFISQVLMRHASQLLELVHAKGVAIAIEQQISLIGQTPSLKEVQDFLDWLPQLNQPEIYCTDCLIRPYPPASTFKDTASGVLVISIVLHQKSYHLLWFRPEQIQTVNWAGDPLTAVLIDPNGEKQLTPRRSFALWKETVQNTCFPWKLQEIEAALMMRNTLMLAVLEFSQAALEQAAERAASANRAKSQFLAKMSHELRTPLNAILGFTQVMNRSPDIPAEFQEHLGIINRSGEHLLTLINDVLEMSKIEADQLVLTEWCFDLFHLIDSIQDMFALKASQKGLQLKVERAEMIPRYICGDEAKLRQILINLLNNAIKFTTYGSVTLRLNSKPATSPPEADSLYSSSPHAQTAIVLHLEVEDTGCGIATNDLESIFEAFMQTDRGRHIQGTGLGLSISRQFARLMKGDITVQSYLNRGSTFTCQVTVHLPESLDLVEPDDDRHVMGLETDQPVYRILVVEDVLENRQLLTTLLTSVGFEVYTVENGAEAIVQWQQWHPHLIFMDIEMPILNGYDATRQIRLHEQQREAEGNHLSFSSPSSVSFFSPTKIIALTAYAFEDDRTASLQAGCDDYIAKPFRATTVFDTIARHLGVRYRYRDPLQASLLSAKQPLTPQNLQLMSTEWIAQVHEAALDLNDGKVRQLIAQIPQQEQPLIEAMTNLVDHFQLEMIATLTQV